MYSKLNKIIEKQSEPYRPLILVVDNDYDNLLLASYVVESLGMAFIFTDKSEECLNLIDKLSPDLVLLDIVMPKINGLELARLIKQDRNIAHIPIIA
ncbi:MAG: PleD family two-component system response regulator, partial [Xenococcaceae cyanobacterium]